MANRFWVGGTGNTSDTAHWSTATGGAGGASVPVAADAAIWDANSFSTTGLTCTVDAAFSPGSINFTGVLHSPTFNYTGQTITCAGNATFVTGMTVTGNGSSVLAMTGNAAQFTPATRSFPGLVSMTGSGACNLLNSGTFVNFTRTGTAATGDALQGAATITVTGTLTLNGNSVANRLMVWPNSQNLTLPIVCNGTVAAQYVAFAGIVASGSASWDLSAITGGSGDVGGNSGIVFTAPGSQYWVGNTGNWSVASNWASTPTGLGGSGRSPLPQDTAFFTSHSFSGTGQTCTIDVRHVSAIDASAVTNSPTIHPNITTGFAGNITLAAGVVLSLGSNVFVHEAMGGKALTFTSNGATVTATTGIFGIDASNVGGVAASSLTLTDAFSYNGLIRVGYGTLIASSTVQASSFKMLYDTTKSSVVCGSGTWTLTGTSGTVWDNTSAGSVSAAAATIIIGSASASSRTFAGGGRTYGTLQYTVAASTGALVITGANTFGTLDVENEAGNVKTLTLPSGVTTTCTTFILEGVSGSLAVLNSSTPGSAAILSVAA